MLLSQNGSTFAQAVLSKLLSPEVLEETISAMRGQGKTIVTLNGSFDLMHAGHLEILYQASLQGDILLVLLNTDRSIQKYKGPLRPIISLEFRMRMMAALEMVDYVTWFDEADPCMMLRRIAPHVHVNGAEYGENCVEAETVRSSGGKLHLVESLPGGFSTSQIIKKIVETCA